MTQTVPPPEPEPEPAPRQETAPPDPRSELEAAITVLANERVAPPRVPLSYLLGLFLAGLLVLTLPLIYLAIIAAIGSGIAWHAVENAAIFESTSGLKGRVFAYVAPIVVGLAVLFALLKPFLAPRRKPPPQYTLKREDQPRLFAFIDAICTALRAPRPREVAIDNRVNASASLRSPLSRDLRLTIGMPLFAGLNARQLGGVLAHEFGHFSQGFAMRFSFTLASIANWLNRCAHERDRWDDKLEQMGRDGGFFMQIIGALCRFFIGIGRAIIGALAWVGRMATLFLMRRMEFDADKLECGLAGSETFGETCFRLHMLASGTQPAEQSLHEAQQSNTLPDDLAQLLQLHASPPSEENRAQFEQALDGETPDRRATHPTTRERIDAARQAGLPGLFTCEAPAHLLLNHPGQLSKNVTLHEYRKLRGLSFATEQLRPSRDLIQARREHEVLDRCYQTTWGAASLSYTLSLPMPPEFYELSASGQLNKEQLATSWMRFSEDNPGEHEAGDAYDALLKRLNDARKVKLLHSVGIVPNKGFEDFADLSDDELDTIIVETIEQLGEHYEERVVEFQHRRVRLLTMVCMSILQIMPEAKREDAADRIRRANAILRAMADNRTEHERLFCANSAIETLLANQHNLQQHIFEKAARHAISEMEEALAAFLPSLDHLPCPRWIDFKGHASTYVKSAPHGEEESPVAQELARHAAMYARVRHLMDGALADIARIAGAWLLKFGTKK